MLTCQIELESAMIFEERLQQALEETGISQSELGRRVGVNSQSVSGWCKGILPRKDKLELLPEALGRPLHWFFMLPEDEERIRATTESKVVLSDAQARMLEIFDQLPGEEQERFISLAALRLEELDRFMQEYLNRRKIEPTNPE